MSLFKVTVNGRVHIVEAPTKSTAGAWGNNQLEVTVEVAKTSDLKGVDLDNVPEALVGGKTKPVEAPAVAAAEPSWKAPSSGLIIG